MTQVLTRHPHPTQTVNPAIPSIERDTRPAEPKPVTAAVLPDEPSSLAELVAALRAHEAQAVEQQRRSKQAALQARQRFD